MYCLFQDTDRLSQDTDRLSQNTDRLSQDTDRLSQDTDRQSQDTGRLSQDTDQLSSSGTRLLWGEGTTLSHEAHDMFEVSGQYLSTQHSALEEVVTGHGDVVEDLRSRVEVRFSPLLNVGVSAMSISSGAGISIVASASF